MWQTRHKVVFPKNPTFSMACDWAEKLSINCCLFGREIELARQCFGLQFRKQWILEKISG
jgi:hypothetical protein